jgi:hypothetical protein
MSDFACYISVLNRSNLTFDVSAPPPDYGHWENVPQQIAPMSRVAFVLRDPSGPAGSEGGFDLFAEGAGVQLHADFQDGYVQSNYCNISMPGGAPPLSWTFQGASGDDNPPNWEYGDVPGGGHPVYLKFIFTDPSVWPPQAGGAASGLED